MTRSATLRRRFLELHQHPPDEPTPGILVTLNPWDVGSAKLLVESGALALATTSSGHGVALGRVDQNIDRHGMIAHVNRLCAAVDVPISVDSEDCFGEDVAGVRITAAMIADTDAAGFSIEDYDPHAELIRPIDVSTRRVAAAKEAADDLVLTARCENHLWGIDDLDDTIARLQAYRSAGADVVYAPGLISADDIGRVVAAVDCPVNVLALPGTPTVPELAALGVARVSVGSLIARAAYRTLVDAAEELLGSGTSRYADSLLDNGTRDRVFSSHGREAVQTGIGEWATNAIRNT